MHMSRWCSSGPRSARTKKLTPSPEELAGTESPVLSTATEVSSTSSEQPHKAARHGFPLSHSERPTIDTASLTNLKKKPKLALPHINDAGKWRKLDKHLVANLGTWFNDNADLEINEFVTSFESHVYDHTATMVALLKKKKEKAPTLSPREPQENKESTTSPPL